MKNLEPFLLCERSSEPFVLLCVLRAPLRDLCGKTFLTESVQKSQNAPRESPWCMKQKGFRT